MSIESNKEHTSNSNSGNNFKRRNMQQNKVISLFSVYVSLAFIFSYIESIIPFSLGIPGVKLGLANIIIVFALYTLPQKRHALYISVIRIILVGCTFGNLSMMIYGISGGLLSAIIMIIFSRLSCFSIMGISILGGVFHNIGQLIVAVFVLNTSQLAYYLPILLISGIVTGLFIGLLARSCIKRFKLLNNNS